MGPWDNIERNAFAIRHRGMSMLPRFRAGDLIVVDPTKKVCNGDICMAALKTKRICRIIKYEGGNIRLTPLNERYRERIITGKRLRDFRVIGKVLGTFAEV